MKIEYFLRELNGWLSLDIEEYINLIFQQEEHKITKIESLLDFPIKIISEYDKRTSISKPECLISGNYVEVLIQQELNLASNHKREIKISFLDNDNNKRQYNFWARAKIVSYDSSNNILLLEYNDELILIDDMCKIRELSSLTKIGDDISLYYLKKISTSEYEKFKIQYENTQKKIDEEIKHLLHHNFNNIKSSLTLICPKEYVNNLPLLREFELKYESNNNEESFTEITSRSGRSEESYKNENRSKKPKNSKSTDIFINEEEILNQIHKYKFNQIFVYKSIFKKDAEKLMRNIIKKNNYYINIIDSEEFKIILYGNNEADFNEEKNIIQKEYKLEKLNIVQNIDKSEIINLANSMKVKYIYFDKKCLYLIGEEKSISSFKTMLKVKLMYTKEIQKSNRENERIQKKITDIKKEYKIN